MQALAHLGCGANLSAEYTMPLDKDKRAVASDRIRTIRVVAILLVTLVHLQPGLSSIEGAPILVEMTRFIAINIFGYASVPILSVISGWLLVDSFASKAGYLKYVSGRFSILYLPLFSWCSILALLLATLDLAGFQTNLFVRLKELPLYDALLAVMQRPVNYPLYFLRDIFVLSLFAPPIIWLAGRAPLALLAFAAFCFVTDLGSPVLLRPMTFLFVSIGVILRCSDCDPLAIDRYKTKILIVAAFFWAAMLYYLLEIRQTEDIYSRVKYLDLVNRVVVALVFWVTADSVLQLAGRYWIHRMERRIYLVFLSHVVVITLVGGAFGVVFRGLDNYAYLLLLAVTPIYCYIGGEVIFEIVSRLPRPMQTILMGKPMAERIDS